MITTKKGIFISHIHEEAQLGAVVKEWLSDAFAGSGVNAFLSSDKQSLPAGSKWLDVIRRQIADAGVMISLISPTSLIRPWVNIELGGAWLKDVPIIPLCHSQQKIGVLPKPFDDFTALTLEDDNAARDLVSGVADALRLAHPKKLAFTEFLKEMRGAAAKSDAMQVVASPAAESTEGLPYEQVNILKMLAAHGNENSDAYVNGADAPSMSGLKPMVFKFHSEQLDEAGLIDTGWWTDIRGDGSHYRITGDGAGWLIAHGLMPE